MSLSEKTEKGVQSWNKIPTNPSTIKKNGIMYIYLSYYAKKSAKRKRIHISARQIGLTEQWTTHEQAAKYIDATWKAFRSYRIDIAHTKVLSLFSEEALSFVTPKKEEPSVVRVQKSSGSEKKELKQYGREGNRSDLLATAGNKRKLYLLQKEQTNKGRKKRRLLKEIKIKARPVKLYAKYARLSLLQKRIEKNEKLLSELRKVTYAGNGHSLIIKYKTTELIDDDITEETNNADGSDDDSCDEEMMQQDNSTCSKAALVRVNMQILFTMSMLMKVIDRDYKEKYSLKKNKKPVFVSMTSIAIIVASDTSEKGFSVRRILRTYNDNPNPNH